MPACLIPYGILLIQGVSVVSHWQYQDVVQTIGNSAQNLLPSILLFKNVQIRIKKAIMLLVVLYGCETPSLTLREEHRLGVFENRVLRKII
jgi:hypothetical protein